MTTRFAESAETQPTPPGAQPIVVDLDGTLVRNDTLHEQLVRLAVTRPGLLPGLVRELFHGKAALKRYCADHVTIDPSALNACTEMLDYLRGERARGTRIILCTAADIRVATAVAESIGLFDEVIGTENGKNLRGPAKAALLARRFPDGFIYAGDHAADLAVWREATGILLAGASRSTAARARALGKPVLAEFRPHTGRQNPLKIWARALRVHHWSKNLLIFVPLLLAHRWFDPTAVAETLTAFILLLLVTSGSYIINDLVDLDADRHHATKRHRPIASNSLSLLSASVFPLVAIPLALGGALLLGAPFAAALAAYLVMTLAYSFRLKRVPLLDILVIAALFTLRLVMGATLLSAAVPVWLLTFSMFFFFSLATAKRHTELLLAGRGGRHSLGARGYEAADWPLTLALGTASALASLVILVLYMVDEAFRVVGYARPEVLWLATFFMAIWLGRVWLLTHRGRMLDDPVSFALRDRSSLFLALAIGLCFLLAL